MNKCSWRVIPSHSSVQPLPFPFIFCSPSTCPDQWLCSQMPGELISPCPQYYFLGFFSCHFITSVYPILPLLFPFIFNFLKINLDSVRNGSFFPLNHLEITWSQNFAVFVHQLPGRWRAAVLFLWKAEKSEIKVLTLFSVICTVFVVGFLFYFGAFFFSFQAFSPVLSYSFLMEKIYFSCSIAILDLWLMNGAPDCPADFKPLWAWSNTLFPVIWMEQGHSLSSYEVLCLNHTI